MKKNITTFVYPIGTTVEFGDSAQKIIIGQIAAINIRKTYTIYEINYWLLDDLKTIYLSEDHFKILNKPEKKEIGFKNI